VTALRIGGDYMGGTGRSASTKSVRGAEMIASFYTATIIEMIGEKNTILDQHLRTIFAFVSGGIIGSFQTDVTSRITSDAGTGGYLPTSRLWRRCSCMIISQICLCVKLAQPFVTSVLDAMCTAVFNYRTDSSASDAYDISGFIGDVTNPMEDVLLAMLVVTSHQKVNHISTDLAHVVYFEYSLSSEYTINLYPDCN
jgi:hypothetical protein